MRKLRLMLALLALSAFAQAATTSVNIPNVPPAREEPDCQIIGAPFTAAGNSVVFDNRPFGCTNWTLVYNAQNSSAVSIEFQSADEAAGSAGTPGTFTTWGTSGGSLASGTALPLTATTSAQANGYGYRPFLQVKLNSITGGSVNWKLYGYRSYGNDVATADPCQSAQVLKKHFKAAIASATAVSLVAAVANQTVYPCGWEAVIQGSITTVGTVTLEYGTQTTNPCDTGTTTLTPAFPGNINANVPFLVGRSGPGTLYQIPAGKQLCAVSTGTTIGVTIDGTFVQQ